MRLPGAVDYVLHFASPASPVDYLKLPIETLKVGSLGTHNALELALAKKAKFFVASTSECYGDPDVTPQSEEYWGHVNPVGPRGCYDEAKRFAEAMTMAYHRYHGVDTHIVRIFNTYGPRMRLNDGRALPNFVYQALSGQADHRVRRRKADAEFLLCIRPDRRDLQAGDVGRTHADQHRQSAGDHDPAICGADSESVCECAADYFRAVAAGRSEAAVPGHQQSQAAAELGAEGGSGRRTGRDVGVFQAAVATRQESAERRPKSQRRVAELARGVERDGFHAGGSATRFAAEGEIFEAEFAHALGRIEIAAVDDQAAGHEFAGAFPIQIAVYIPLRADQGGFGAAQRFVTDLRDR